MAEKDFKRKFRSKPVAAAAAGQDSVARRADRDPDTAQAQHDVGAHYSAGPAYGLALAAPSPRDDAPRDEAEVAEERMRGAPQGEPLPASLRRRYETALGHDLGAVRLHRGPAAERAAGDLQSRAFTYRNQIWLGPGANPADTRLMAHELTHVIQQGHAPALAHRGALAMPTRAANSPVHGVPAGPRAAPASAGGAVQRWSLWGAARRFGGAVASGVRAVGGAVARAAGNLLTLGKKALFAIIRRVAPSFLPLFQGDGIAGFLRRLIRRGLHSLFSGLTAPLRGILSFGHLGARVSAAISWISTIAGQLANNDCSGVLAAARRVGAFFSRALSPVINRIKSIAKKVSGFFRSIWNAIGAPVMQILRRIGGAIWQSLRGFISSVGRLIRRVRGALGAAWTKVKGWLGIKAEDGEEEGGGLWNWIRDKAAAIGRAISRVVRPIIGPLRQAGGVLLLLVPGGQLAGIILLWPELRRAFAWLSQRWHDLNLIPRARAFLANTVLPAVIHAAESVAQAFLRGADWLLGLLDRIAGVLARAMRAATGIFAPLGRLIGFARSQFHRLVTWARSGLRYVSRNFRTLMQRLIRFLQPILDALRQLIMIAVNPFGIVGFLMGTLWRLLPNCLKGPIIDFILSVIIRVLRALPPMPMLGILWPVVKSAMLGFLEQVLGFPLQRKVNVSNKVARIISGMSPTFLIGYLRGIALGVWNGITAPFQAIASIFELPAQIQAFLSNLGLRLCDLVEQIRCFAANLVGQVFGSVDSILRALGELLRDPSRILDLIRCAIEGILSTAHTLGQQVANRMMTILEGPDDTIGEQLGRVTGRYLLRAVITYFTAGAGASIGIVQDITRALSTVGRAIREVIGTLRALLGRLVSFIRGLASRFASAVARGARSVLGRLGGFFRRVAAWFSRLFRRLGASLRRRFGLSAQQRLQWIEFRSALHSALSSSQEAGIGRGRLRTVYQGVLRRFSAVAKRPAFITKHGPYWRLWVRRAKSLRPRRVGHVLLDRAHRWSQGRKAVRRAIRALKRRPGNIDSAMIDSAIRPLRTTYHYKSLSTRFEPSRNLFVVDGAMSPGGPVTTTPPERPTENDVQVVSASKHVRVDPLVKRHRRSAPAGSPPHWNAVQPIKSRGGRVSLYIRGHIVSGNFASGQPSNLTPITRSANALMATGAETPVKNDLPLIAHKSSRKPIYKYDVRASGVASAPSPRRKVYLNNNWVCRQIPAEQQLFTTISITVEKFEYNPSSKKWDRQVPAPTPGPINNVPPYPTGFGEPC